MTAGTRTALGAVTAERALSTRGQYRGTLAVSRLEDSFFLDAGDCFDAIVVNGPHGGPTCDEVPRVNHSVHVRDIALRQDVTWRASARHLLDGGVEVHDETSRLTLDSQFANFPALSIPGFGMFTVGRAPWHLGPQPLDSSVNGNKAGAWIEDQLHLGSAVSVVPGARVDRLTATDETVVSPRLRSSVRLGDRTSLTAAAGVHYQSPGYDKAFLGGDAFGLDLSAPGVRLRSERAIQTVAGVERDLGAGVSARIEAYHRSLERLIVGRLETDQERASRLAEYPPAAWRGLEADIPTEPLITNVPANDGSGRVTGAEFLLTKGPAHSRYSGWLSYTLSKADRTTYGITYPFEYDRRHVFALAGQFELTPRLMLSTSVQAASGLPVSLPIGAQVAAETFFANGHNPFIEPFVVGGTVPGGPQYAYQLDYGALARINSSRLPAMARVDARITLHPASASGHWTFYVDVINVLDRRNQESVFSDLTNNPSGAVPLVRNSYGGGFPILPTFGLRARF